MREEQRVVEAGLAAAKPRRQRDTGKRLRARQVLLGKGQRHEARALIDQPQAEPAGDVVAHAGRAHLRDRASAGRNHHLPRRDRAARRLDREPRRHLPHARHRGVQPQLCPAHAVQQHVDHLPGLPVAEKLPQRLFMPRDTRPIDQRHEILRRVARKRRGAEPRRLRQEPLARRGQIGEVASPPARDPDLLARPPRLVQNQHPPPRPGQPARAEKPGRARAEYDDIPSFHPRHLPARATARQRRGFCQSRRRPPCTPPAAWLNTPALLGRGQVVRHRFLVPCTVGSNPTAPASFSP